jgi:hypothetical protein
VRRLFNFAQQGWSNKLNVSFWNTREVFHPDVTRPIGSNQKLVCRGEFPDTLAGSEEGRNAVN